MINPLHSPRFHRYLLDRMVLRPTRHPIEHPSLRREVLKFADHDLECFVQRNYVGDQLPDLLVLKFPGTAGRAERSSPFPLAIMSGHRVESWTWNPPGYGRSEGTASLPNIAEAAVEFWRQATTRRCHDGTTTWLCGNSLGCLAALHVAASSQLDPSGHGLILRNPPPLHSVVKRILRNYPLGHLLDPVVDSLCPSMNALETAKNTHLPAVFLQSELDSLVLPDDQNQVIASYRGPVRVVVMEGLEHDGIANDDQMIRIADSIQWLWKQTGRVPHVASPRS
jgi:pimeloyl-ACP methyl ester carboxylesterase